MQENIMKKLFKQLIEEKGTFLTSARVLTCPIMG
jgi:hypothetical protein